MKKIVFPIVLLSFISCSEVKSKEEPKTAEKKEHQNTPHKYGGWYCPDNLNGFPAVDVKDWNKVPVIAGRLPTKEETSTEASLMYIDVEEYPTAKALNIKLPQLATYYSNHTRKEEKVIIIQAVEIDGDSIVGFRYLNGGNGSAKFNEVTYLSESEIESIPASNFVSIDIKINADENKVWEVLTQSEHLNELLPTFKQNVLLTTNWRIKTNVNFYYALTGHLTAAFADKLFGCYYIQNDYLISDNSYVEKLLLLQNNEENYIELKVVFGPFQYDYDTQKSILNNWVNQVKKLAENID